MISNGIKGISILQNNNGRYCFGEQSEQIPEEFETYDYINLSSCDSMEELLAAIMEANVNELVLIGDKEAETLFEVLIHRLRSVDENVTVRVQLRAGEQNSDSYTKEAEKAVYAMMTGNYSKSEDYQKAKHLFVSDINFLNKNELCNDMDLNSEIFLPLSEYDEKTYQSLKSRYYNHIHFVGEDRIYLDGRERQIPLLQAHYAEWSEKKDTEKNYYIELESKEDYEKLYSDLDYLRNTGKVRNYHFHLINECRWTRQCNLSAQRRYVLQTEKTASICNPIQSFSFGGDSYKQYEEREKVLNCTVEKRQCEHCAVKAWCSSCSGLTKEAEKHFCSTMQNHLEVIDFIQIKNVLLKLEKMEHQFSLEEIAFASFGHTLLVPKAMTGKKPITHNKYLFEANGAYYYFDYEEECVCEITKEHAVVMEAVLKGYEYEQTREAFQTSFALEGFETAWEKVSKMMQ